MAVEVAKFITSCSWCLIRCTREPSGNFIGGRNNADDVCRAVITKKMIKFRIICDFCIFSEIMIIHVTKQTIYERFNYYFWSSSDTN